MRYIQFQKSEKIDITYTKKKGIIPCKKKREAFHIEKGKKELFEIPLTTKNSFPLDRAFITNYDSQGDLLDSKITIQHYDIKNDTNFNIYISYERDRGVFRRNKGNHNKWWKIKIHEAKETWEDIRVLPDYETKAIDRESQEIEKMLINNKKETRQIIVDFLNAHKYTKVTVKKDNIKLMSTPKEKGGELWKF
ncbi:hypothetical protein [Ilyobacter polytropus]|uniref:Uncharacterized protein n=1 Tax=Ilyobacter polytropus (strain ATCC 51220 / DSM 2926 / LMG 16218 / CuHBu1) TaxID=572544 RepID=E3HBC8_ILYPC|nr:hypothetical protein [Ilyobacter polytropus]ADO83743.1 hypothetical protein Ilyop_1972 [Ilyobacter polytropus DSM 2926]